MEYQDLLDVVEKTEDIFARNKLEGDPSFVLMIEKPAPINDKGRVLVLSSPMGEQFDLYGDIVSEDKTTLAVVVRCQAFRLSVPVHLPCCGQGLH